MLSRIDEIIFPNRCEVIEFQDPQRFVYPIFKNGRSSLMQHAIIKNYKTLLNEQIRQLSQIDVILREPLPRFVSGVNTFVFNLKKNEPTLDIGTVLYFVNNYLFLNRHYCPQLSWIINLSKYTSKSTKLKLLGIESLNDYTPRHVPPTGEEKILSADVIDQLQNNIHNVPYLKLDNLLLELIGKTLTIDEILEYIKAKDFLSYQKLKCTALD